MQTINRLINTLGIIFFLLIIIAFNFLIGLYFVSLVIVPATWLWAKFTDQSYSALIDSSNMLYKVNIFGQWAWFLTACLSVTYFILWQLFF